MPVPRLLKWLLWTIGTLLSLAVVAILLIRWFLPEMMGETSNDEVARIISPSGNVEAVLFETNAGATTSFGYEVFVVERGTKPSGSPAVSLYGAVRNPHAYGVNVKWLSPSSLAIEYLSAKSVTVNMQTQSIGMQTIEFALRDGVTDNAAPSGGMVHNLRGRQ
jgi:hypothetical protein